jgi:hypothetical protein
MSQSHVPTAPKLDILSETVTDTQAAAPGVTAQMQRIFGELDNAAAQSALFMATQSLLSLLPPLGGKEKAEVTLLNLRNREVFLVADEQSAQITADFIGKHEVKRQDRSVSGQGTTYNYRTEEQHKIKPAILRGLPKYTAIVCHANGRFRKTLIPPRDNQGRIAEWWLQRDAPPLYKLQVRLGLIK